MTFQLSFGQIRQYESREAAERAVEIFFPAGYYYEVLPRCCNSPTSQWTVKAYRKTGEFAGYCYDPESEI